MIEIDVNQQLRFPEAIFISTEIPDIVIYSLNFTKTTLVGKEFLRKCLSWWFSKAGCKTNQFAIEVGARRYVAYSLRSCWSRLTFIQRSVRDIIKMASDTALKSVFWIWLKRMVHDWSHTERRKQSLVKSIRNNNPCNYQNRLHSEN